jgi:hypothetical protein
MRGRSSGKGLRGVRTWVDSIGASVTALLGLKMHI